MTTVHPDIVHSQRRRLHLLAASAAFVAGIGQHESALAEPLRIAAGKGAYAMVDDLRVYYELHGGSPTGGKTPIVLMHGGALAIETAFGDDLLPRLARTRPVIAIEQQGHGHTSDRNGPILLKNSIFGAGSKNSGL